MNELFFPKRSPFPAVPLTNLVFDIPLSAHLHFIILRPFLVLTYVSDPETHSFFFLTSHLHYIDGRNKSPRGNTETRSSVLL